MPKMTLNELMGSKGGAKAKAKKLSLGDLGDLLGEKMPKLEYNAVGRMRLTNALRNRFGDGYKSLPGIEEIMKEFDDEARFAVKLQEMKMIKPRGK